ncbi:MAG TPA: protein phosphatase 2C domain-containing protein [Opitutaceae bacterium]|nr:protein phosphatase 2C domain-containing protein [Opitutaceae bacterium]HND62630.1 protein phosphatase 2C domain-containing protein [Opitutaceae bacterium]
MDDPTLVHVDGLTDIGTRRTNNEDAWWAGRPGGEHQQMMPGPAALQLDAAEGPVLLLVSDGVGGANAGEVASQMAVTLVAAVLAKEPAPLRSQATAGAALLRAFGAAHEAILRQAEEPSFDGMGATLSALVFTADGHACWAQAGDSRIYLFRGGRLRQLSRDHSPVGRLRQSGRLTEEEARKHPARNQIDLSLGDRLNPFDPETGVEEAKEGDVFLVCSDGLSDGLWDHDLAKILAELRGPEDVRPIVTGLVDGAKQASGRDNITAVVALVGPAKKASARWRRIFG